jgi:hypothetical protein
MLVVLTVIFLNVALPSVVVLSVVAPLMPPFNCNELGKKSFSFLEKEKVQGHSVNLPFYQRTQYRFLPGKRVRGRLDDGACLLP